MMFGLVNSGSADQRIVCVFYRKVKHADANVDDICVHHSSFNHFSELKMVLECLSKANLQLRKDKCMFGYTEGEFLGHLLCEEGHCLSPRLVEKIREAEIPRNKKELLWLLGLANFYREYVP